MRSPLLRLWPAGVASIGQIEDTYHRFLVSDEERYGAALDGYGAKKATA